MNSSAAFLNQSVRPPLPFRDTGIVLLRHGESTDTAAGLVSGWRDVDLTENGRLQILDILVTLPRLGIRSIVSSDLRRARSTAQIIVHALALPAAREDRRLRERAWGAREGNPHAYAPAPGEEEAEAEEQFAERVTQALNEIPPGTLIVTHAGVIRFIRKIYGLTELVIPPAGLCELGHKNPRVDHWALPRNIQVDGAVITPGDFTGRVVYVSEETDLETLATTDVALLQSCSKSVAFTAVSTALATVNLTRSLTQHITHGRDSHHPYAVATSWPMGYPRNGESVKLLFLTSDESAPAGHLPDFPPSPVQNVDKIGGKAAGLELLLSKGFNVPPFITLTHNDINGWESVEGFDFGDEVIGRLKSQLLEDVDRGSWAVRSSSDLEDADGTPLSGSFKSFVDVGWEQIPKRIRDVRASVRGSEIRARLRSGNLSDLPRMSVVVQRMVTDLKFAGTVFVPSPQDFSSLLIEAQCRRSAEGLMDGRENPDVVEYYVCTHLSPEITARAGNPHSYLKSVAIEAFRIYSLTGRGDLEFAVDMNDRIWWLQARMLNAAIEVVDRRGFSATAKAYYRMLAFGVHVANQTQASFFRSFELSDGRLGYSVGIRHRDRVFHDKLRSDLRHLEEVIAFGWMVEEHLAKLVCNLESTDNAFILEQLVLHGAVQLPFSIPMDGSFMSRFRSKPLDSVPSKGMLEEFLSGIINRIPGGWDVGRVREILLQPRSTYSTIATSRVLLRLSNSPPGILTRLEIVEYWASEWRDLPDMSETGLAKLGKDLSARLMRIRSSPTEALQLLQKVDSYDSQCQQSRLRRESFLALARTALPHEDWCELDLWAKYLEMKAETNETHALYRGQCFAHFALHGFVALESDIDRICRIWLGSKVRFCSAETSLK